MTNYAIHKKCSRCQILAPLAEYHNPKGRDFRHCRDCRGRTAGGTIRTCAGYPGYKCEKQITDYRCPKCWAKVRNGTNPDAHYTEADLGCTINTGRR